MGKWDDIAKTLTRLPPQDEKHQQKVDAEKTRITEKYGVSPTILAELYRALRDDKEKLDEKEKALNLALEAARQLIVDVFEVEGISSIRLDKMQGAGGLLYTSPEPYPQFEDKERYRVWCVDVAQLAQEMHLNFQTTKAMLKERLENGQEPQPGIKAFFVTNVAFRKS